MILFMYYKVKLLEIISPLLYYTFFQIHKRTNRIKGARIIYYHEVDKNIFEKHIKYIRQNYDIISLDELLECIKNDKIIPDNSVIITFDDGYKSLYYNVYPIVKKYKIPITIYVVPDVVNKKIPFWWDVIDNIKKIDKNIPNVTQLKNMPNEEKEKIVNSYRDEKPDLYAEHNSLDWNQINEMIESKLVSIQSHSSTHPILTQMSYDEVSVEIKKSKQNIQDKTGTEVVHFAYPSGKFVEEYIPLLEEHGYESAVILKPGIISRKTNPYLLARIFSGNINTYLLALQLELFYSRFYRVYFRIKRFTRKLLST